jgi:cell division protein FtsW (lipid II flippase)
MVTQILKYNLEFVLHDARIYVFCVLHMNFGLIISVVLLLLLLITFMHGISNYRPETKPCVYGTYCCSYSVVTRYGTCSVISYDKRFVFLQ